jgi:hypothetical protein
MIDPHGLRIYQLELPAGDDQLIVTYVNQDEGTQVDVEAMLRFCGEDAATRATSGWRLVSVGGLPLRQMGTAGNVIFQSGGQYATQGAIVAVYARNSAGGKEES